MLKISEGDIKSLYAMKLVPPKNLRSIVHLSTIHSNTIPESSGSTLNSAFSVTNCLELHNAISFYSSCNV